VASSILILAAALGIVALSGLLALAFFRAAAHADECSERLLADSLREYSQRPGATKAPVEAGAPLR
jgi:hypothetical protein